MPVPKKSRKTRGKKKGRSLFRSAWFKVFAALVIVATIAGGTVVLSYYGRYATIIDRRLSGDVFANTARIYATPYIVHPGKEITPDEIALRLRRAGFEHHDGTLTDDGTYNLTVEDGSASIVVSPAGRPDFRLEFVGQTIISAAEVLSGFPMDSVELPPELVTTLFDDTRSKRRLLTWEQLPPQLTDAIIASEDQRFYRHFGIDLIRGAGAAYANFRGQDRQGASTLTMQLAGSFFLNRNERTWNRKLPEIFMALILEQRLTKQQIFTMYANEMYLGHRGSFAINGFGEAAAAYFGKEVADLSLSESAALVGMLPAPNAYAPTRNLERSMTRRDTVVNAMYELDMINMSQLIETELSQLTLQQVSVDESDAPYMVDYIRDRLLDDFSDQELVSGGMNVYTTLDPDLQRAAVEAVALGIANADEQLEALGRGTSSGRPPVQASLIALDPHTGAIKAMVGGRDYGASQYNRITEAFRQPGSIFKPFVYAAAFETAFDPLPLPEDDIEEISQDTAPIVPEGLLALLGFESEPGPEEILDPEEIARLAEEERIRIEDEALREEERRQRLRDQDETPFDADGRVFDLDPESIPERDERGTIRSDRVLTPMTTVSDEPTYFFYEEESFYKPDNYRDVFHGMITLREALQRSLNVPTVKVAERVGFDKVADLAHRVGFNADIQPYPSIALGSFEVTPIEIAGAWSALANEGVRVAPRAIYSVESSDGEVLKSYPLESEAVLRPELAAMMTNLLENVINRGTGVGVRSRGFTLPAAGKTGTSRDGWFAGYTKDLLVIAWVGFDDNRELDLEGSRSALPIWTSFMLEADRLYPVQEGENVEFTNPPGVERVAIDGETLALASPTCITRFFQVFIRGTAPTNYCPIHGFGNGFFLSDAIEGIGRAVSGVLSDEP
jgi:membrane peptidoglycan carboxypeptidase